MRFGKSSLALFGNTTTWPFEQLDDQVLVQAEEPKDQNQLFSHLFQLLLVMVAREIAGII